MGGREPPSGGSAHTDPTVLRPDVQVLPDEALVPDANVIRPPPNRFTHKLLIDEPYCFERSARTGESDGALAAGTPVVVLIEGPDRCRVVDGRGLYVEVSRASLGALADG